MILAMIFPVMPNPFLPQWKRYGPRFLAHYVKSVVSRSVVASLRSRLDLGVATMFGYVEEDR